MVWKSDSPKHGFSFSAPSPSNLSYLSEMPSFTTISDAHLVVAFKNLLKKDTNTKTKALGDILAHVEAHPHESGGVEDAVIEAWVALYPRMSIENDRRVRELSHTVQLGLLRSARKRMERHIPTVVGPWLAGMYDRDTAVAKAANEGFSTFLTTPQKWDQFWRRCRGRLLEYVESALAETADTLSDERTTSKEDAERKLARVRAGTLDLICGMIEHAPDGLETEERFLSVMESGQTWVGVSDADLGMRRAVCQLVLSCTDGEVDYLGSHLAQVKGKFVLDGLKQQHQGSAAVYVSALQSLTAKHPEIWTPTKGKEVKLVKSILAFVEGGSRGGPAWFWDYLGELAKRIPILAEGENRGKLLSAMRTGLARRDELRPNALAAWTAYLGVAQHFATLVLDSEKEELLKEHVFPVFNACVFPDRPESWKIMSQPYKVLSKAYPLISKGSATFEAHLDDLSSQICELVSAPPPESSSECSASQQKLADAGVRWFEVTAVVRPEGDVDTALAAPTEAIVGRCAGVLGETGYKAWGAASILASAAASRSGFGLDKVSSFFEGITQDQLSVAISSPSASHLLRCFKVLSSNPSQSPLHRSLWATWTLAIIQLPESQHRTSALDSLFTFPPDASFVHAISPIQEFILETCTSLAQGGHSEWTIGEAAVQTNIIAHDRLSVLVRTCISAIEDGHSEGIRLLHSIAIHSASSALALDADEQTALLTLLLKLDDQDPETSSHISAIRDALGGVVADDGRPVLSIIKSNLEMVGQDSLNVDLVYNLAIDMLGGGETAAEDVVPSTASWSEAVKAVVGKSFGCAAASATLLEEVYLLVGDGRSSTVIPTDRSGASVAARIGAYMTRLLSSNKLDLASLPQQLQIDIVHLLMLTRVAASAQQAVGDASDGLWKSVTTHDQRRRADILVLAITQVIDKIFKTDNSKDRAIVEGVYAKSLERARKLTPVGVFNAEVLAHVVKSSPSQDIEKEDAALNIWKATPETILPAVALLRARRSIYAETPPRFISTLVNNLISDAAVAKPEDPKSIFVLVLLNAALDVFSSAKLPVANTRVVFAVRQLTSWTTDSLTPHQCTELCKALSRLLPEIKDLYGPYWQSAVDLCFAVWDMADKTPLDKIAASSYAALSLYNLLSNLDDPNDDLVDILASTKKQHASSIVKLFKAPHTSSTPVVARLDTLLCKQVCTVPADDLHDHHSAFFGLLASDVKQVQTAALHVLSKSLPEAQQQLAMDAALDKAEVLLPDELVSLLLDAPTLEQYPDEQVLSTFPPAIRSYLLAWLLVFDTIDAAPNRIRPDYIDHLRREQRLEDLLTFAADVLGHTAVPPNPINLDQCDITPEMRKEYNIDGADKANNPELAMDWLLVHLLFRTLQLLPNMFRAWLFNSVKTGIRQAMSAWVSRFLTPLLIDTILQDVVEWADTAKPDSDDEQPLIVKTNRAGSVVTAGYEVDGQLASIGIHFSATYPMDLAQVQKRNHAVGSDAQWASWLKVTESLIATSNGNVIDGLLAFKRNIAGALHGQDECAICYAVVASDKKLPDMKCATCRHSFHRVCLYKWFQTSNQNTCPLCRTEMNWHSTRGRRRE